MSPAVALEPGEPLRVNATKLAAVIAARLRRFAVRSPTVLPRKIGVIRWANSSSRRRVKMGTPIFYALYGVLVKDGLLPPHTPAPDN
jgi:hypothetical protein